MRVNVQIIFIIIIFLKMSLPRWKNTYAPIWTSQGTFMSAKEGEWIHLFSDNCSVIFVKQYLFFPVQVQRQREGDGEPRIWMQERGLLRLSKRCRWHDLQRWHPTNSQEHYGDLDYIIGGAHKIWQDVRVPRWDHPKVKIGRTINYLWQGLMGALIFQVSQYRTMVLLSQWWSDRFQLG